MKAFEFDAQTAMLPDATLTDVAEASRGHANEPLDAFALPALDAVTRQTHERAARIIERCGYEITGYTLSHKSGARKAAVDGSSVRWFPNEADFTRMMQWKEPIGPGTPPLEATGDALLAPDSHEAMASAKLQAVAPARPILAAPPSMRLIDSAEDALGALAMDLGCVWNDSVPHNSGWFVPGKPTAHASALDAIKALFVSLKSGGTVYMPKSRTDEGALIVARERVVEKTAQHEQTALF